MAKKIKYLTNRDDYFGHEVGDTQDYILYAKYGDDHICMGGGNDEIHAGAGNDIVYAGSGNDYVYGGSGQDRLEGQQGHDVLFGEGGNDRIHGGSGDDELYGDSGGDMLNGDSGNDLLHGGAGTDTANYGHYFGSTGGFSNWHHVVVQLAEAGVGSAYKYATSTVHDIDRLISIENVLGSDGDDRITGNYQANTLEGDGGNDILAGKGGNDVLIGGAGEDQINGGADWDIMTGGTGADTFVWSSKTDMSIGGRSSAGVSADFITDFSSNDHIDLSGLDAKTKPNPVTNLNPNDAFHIVTDVARFSGNPGELAVNRVSGEADLWWVSGDTNGDAQADFNFAVHTSPGLNLASSDFWLL